MKGFTLIEILVVLVIVVLVGTLIVGGIDYAKQEAKPMTVKVLSKDIDRFYNHSSKTTDTDYQVHTDRISFDDVGRRTYNALVVGQTYDITIKYFLGSPKVVTYRIAK